MYQLKIQLTSKRGQPCILRQCRFGNLPNRSISSHDPSRVPLRLRTQSSRKLSCGELRRGLPSHSLSEREQMERSGLEQGLLGSRELKGQSATTSICKLGNARPNLHISHHSVTGLPVKQRAIQNFKIKVKTEQFNKKKRQQIQNII